MNEDISRFDAAGVDLLKEIGNIGCGNALTALSQFTSTNFSLTVADIEIVDYEQLPRKTDDLEKLMAGVALDVTGDIEGMFMFIGEEPLVNVLLTKLGLCSSGESLELDEMQRSALSEIGNIIASSYLRAISDLSGLDIRISAPSLAIDMLGAILTLPLLRFAASESKIIYIKSNFMIDSHNYSGDLLLIPEMASVDTMMKKLGVG
ncbi:MAG: chemotaxis protein CheC [Synergistaceae bacterium]|nr:chemotaxis protein CheC [Synergistaceae bacterium]